MSYTITTYHNGKARVSVYASLEVAKGVAQQIFAATGVIVSIEVQS